MQVLELGYHLSAMTTGGLLLNLLGQMPVLHHALHIQVFEADKPWFSVDDRRGGLMYVIGSDICQPVVDSQKSFLAFYQVARFAVTLSFLVDLVFSGYLALQPAPFLLQFSYCVGLVDVPDLGGVRENRQVLDA